MRGLSLHRTARSSFARQNTDRVKNGARQCEVDVTETGTKITSQGEAIIHEESRRGSMAAKHNAPPSFDHHTNSASGLNG